MGVASLEPSFIQDTVVLALVKILIILEICALCFLLLGLLVNYCKASENVQEVE